MKAVPFSPHFDDSPPCTPVVMYLEHPHAVPGLAVGPGQVWARCGKCMRAVATMELPWVEGRDGGKPTPEEIATVLAKFSNRRCPEKSITTRILLMLLEKLDFLRSKMPVFGRGRTL